LAVLDHATSTLGLFLCDVWCTHSTVDHLHQPTLNEMDEEQLSAFSQ
jgi:hypothetical protein